MLFPDPSTAYRRVVTDVWQRPDFISSPRGQVTREKFNYSFEVHVPLFGPIRTGDEERDATLRDYLEKEMRLYAAGTRDAKTWVAQASKFWGGLANPDGTVNSNYGFLIKMLRDHGNPAYGEMTLWTPWEWALYSLLADRDTRQAFVRVSRPTHQWWGNHDQPCTMHLQFRVANRLGVDELDLSVVMRSNDVVKGLPYDMPYFISLQHDMLSALRLGATLPSGEYARHKDLMLGRYFHFAHSMHGYSRDGAVIERLLRRWEVQDNDADPGGEGRRGTYRNGPCEEADGEDG